MHRVIEVQCADFAPISGMSSAGVSAAPAAAHHAAPAAGLVPDQRVLVPEAEPAAPPNPGWDWVAPHQSGAPSSLGGLPATQLPGQPTLPPKVNNAGGWTPVAGANDDDPVYGRSLQE